MKVNLNEEKARNIRVAYLSFFGVSVLSLLVLQFYSVRGFVQFGTIASSIAFGTYLLFFFLNLKLLSKHFFLFVGNICFIFLNLSFVVYALFLDFRGIRELILGALAILLFLLVSKKTLEILLKRYNPETSPST
jgi:hypothetical protein